MTEPWPLAPIEDPAERLDPPALRRRIEDLRAVFSSPPRGLCFLDARTDLFSVAVLLAARASGWVVAPLDPGLSPAARARLAAAYQPDAWARDGTVEALPGASTALHPDLCLLLSTSGSTGGPRMVRLSHTAVAHNAAAIAQVLGLGPHSRALLTLPLHYAFGLSVLHSHLRAGGPLRLSDSSPVQREFWQELDAFGATTWAQVPHGWQLFLRMGGPERSPPSLRELLVAGGRLAQAPARRLAELAAARGGRLWRMYGQTEATARIAVLPPELCHLEGAAGRALPGGQLWIDDDEVVYQGPNVMMGYAETRADLARGDELGGVLRTGDLGHIDADGLLFLHGRRQRFAKIHGQRVGLDEVEALAAAHGPCVALAGEDELLVFGEWPADLSLAALRRELAMALRLHESLLRLERRAALPRLPSGKPDLLSLQGSR